MSRTPTRRYQSRRTVSREGILAERDLVKREPPSEERTAKLKRIRDRLRRLDHRSASVGA